MKSYKELIIWQKSIDLVKLIYSISSEFSQKEQYILTSQINRCAISIPSNIAEGWSRNSTKEFINFLYISRGSLAELETQTIIAKELGYLTDDKLMKIQEHINELGKMLHTIIAKLKEKPIPKC